MTSFDTLLGPSGPTRLLVEAPLRPVQGQRFQPTGFPDLGAAVFEGRDDSGTCVLVESPQSMANRLEEACWDPARQDLVEPLAGLSYVRVVDPSGGFVTSSMTESHRLNSPYILQEKSAFFEAFKKETADFAKGALDRHKLALTVLRYDANALVHGLFLAKSELAGGRLRLERALSGFIEAERARVAASGGVKKDEVNPSGEAKKGFGHVPFQRDEYVADRITAYFNLDLGQIRGYRLPAEAERLIVGLALFKIASFLEGSKRLRSACDLDLAGDIRVTRPDGFALPRRAQLAEELPALVGACRERFASPSGVTSVTWGG
ncbi:MAG: type I-U CRISPR-associated RAMP protein Csb1/Cas7u [Myxococcota bacterium]